MTNQQTRKYDQIKNTPVSVLTFNATRYTHGRKMPQSARAEVDIMSDLGITRCA